MLLAQTDDGGEPLLARCDYLVEGRRRLPGFGPFPLKI
jgi:hypothetical protein